ncbi:MAG: ribose-5-phosphate isomerase ribose 5-phosphate isomerase [Candidatus Saccharibacteria bacterium]|nr:ribose-5-phosphate isomerase ribose 5-phosphate isomerase [Candidatus Saccharibacteria bacterium]
MTIALSTDHAGLEQLREIQDYLEELGYECRNFGPTSLNPDDDYPDFIFPAARAVASGECQMGIIMGASGQGEAMAANRINGVRCAVFYGPAVPKGVVDISGRTSSDPYEIIRLSRQHNDANMLSIAARFVSLIDMKQVVKLWLETDYSHEDRHKRRIEKLDKE